MQSNDSSAYEQGPDKDKNVREEQVRQAVTFLNDPRTQSASQNQKEDFLRRKGLSDTEIRAAYSRYMSAPVDASPPPPVYVRPAFMDEPIVWSAIKSIFSAIGAIAIGVVGYHVYANEIKSGPPKTSDNSLRDCSTDILSKDDIKVVSEERFLETIQELSVKQELRHKELLMQLRDLSGQLSTASIGRKPGGTIVLAERPSSDPSVDSTSASTPPELPVESSTSVSLSDDDIEQEVRAALEAGIDTTLLLVLSSLESNKKLNMTNPRFKKLENNPLMKFVGYNEKDDFLLLGKESVDEGRLRAQRVVSAIKRLKSNVRSQVAPSEEATSSGDSSISSAPWLPTAISTASENS
jgi:hypothetical protein